MSERYFVFPGGGIEKGENPTQAVIREVKEETNLGARSPKDLFQIHHPDHGINYFFLVKDFDGAELKFTGPELANSDESDKYVPRWIPLSTIGGIVLYPEIAKEKLSAWLKN